jgi:hypothetical protein
MGDLVLETLRGGCHAQLTERVYNNWCACNWYPTNASDKSLKLAETDTQGTGLASNTRGTDIYIATTRCESSTGVAAQCDIAAAGVVVERAKTTGHVVVAGCGVKKCAGA